MTRQVIKAMGWRSLRKGMLDGYRCPGCGTFSEELLGFSDGFLCCSCGKSFQLRDFKPIQKEETFAVCAECGREMPLTPFNEGFAGYSCLCGNYVAVPFENQILQPEDILNLSWNEGLAGRAVQLTERCFVTKCETTKDWEVITMLQLLAK